MNNQNLTISPNISVNKIVVNNSKISNILIYKVNTFDNIFFKEKS